MKTGVEKHSLDGNTRSHNIMKLLRDFLKGIPVTADGILLSRMLHDWNDKDALKILSNVYDALTEKGRLYVIETPRAKKYDKDVGLTLDLNMLCMTGGRERTIDELHKLIRRGGFNIEETKGVGLLNVIVSIKITEK